MVKLTKAEYARFMSAVNTNYYDRFVNKDFGRIVIDTKIYSFRIYGFSEYEVIWAGEEK